MQATDTIRDDMHRLAAYLRQNPAALALTPDEIAQRSGVGTEAVRAVISNASGERRDAKADTPRRSLGETLSGFADRLFKYPLAFIVISFAATILLAWLLPEAPKPAHPAVKGEGFTFRDGVQLAICLAMLTGHMFCYYWRARARYAIWGTAIVGIVTTTITLTSISSQPRLDNQQMLPFIAFFGMAIMTVLFGFIGVGFASLGGYVRYKREDAGLRKKTRQELLQRLFEIEEGLRQPEQPLEEERFPWLAPLRRNVFPWAAVVGFSLTIIVSMSTIIFPAPVRSTGPIDASVGFFITQLLFEVLGLAFQIGFAYLGGAPTRSILVSLVYGYSATLAALIPIGSMGYRTLAENWLANFIAGTAMAIILGVFAGLGAAVEQRAYRARRRLANDPQILLSEFVEIQRLLNPTSQSKCVMVVDAAKSSAMKANADPLIAEWSFRAYQEFIAEHVKSCGGAIYSTAGDGAMASFDDASCAFNCARTIQTKVSDFNAYVNKLKDPFRLRIGIHCGEVSGELDEVQFTAVLDIAAHVEAASQVGGIAVTASVKDQLPEHRFAEIQDVIDEQRVFLALNPTLDPDVAG